MIESIYGDYYAFPLNEPTIEQLACAPYCRCVRQSMIPAARETTLPWASQPHEVDRILHVYAV